MGHLTLEQRYKIETYLSLGRNKSEIAAYIGKDKSVISREIKRNADARSGVYKAALADKKAKLRHQTKAKKIHFNDEVKTRVEALIRQDFSPEQIEGRCKMEGIPIVSKETIYQYIWEDKRQGGLLYKHLRTKGKRYRKRGDSNDKRGLIADRVDISMRPEVVDKKLRIGANENLNGLVRQYFPKKTNFENINKQEIERLIKILNNRPRKRFGYKNPNEILAQKLDEMSEVAFNT